MRLIVPALLALAGGTAQAQERRAAFIVGATIVNGCTVATDASGGWGDIALGTVAGLPGSTASGSLSAGGVAGISIECTPGATVSLTADAGLHAQSGTRRLAPATGAARLPYRLFADGSSAPWTTQPLALAFPAGSSRRLLPLRAETTLATALPAGRYADTVRLTLSF